MPLGIAWNKIIRFSLGQYNTQHRYAPLRLFVLTCSSFYQLLASKASINCLCTSNCFYQLLTNNRVIDNCFYASLLLEAFVSSTVCFFDSSCNNWLKCIPHSYGKNVSFNLAFLMYINFYGRLLSAWLVSKKALCLQDWLIYRFSDSYSKHCSWSAI